jgi:DNA-binding transcriptional LysR family regulator
MITFLIYTAVMKPQLLVDLILFIAIVEQKSFTSAANLFGMTKSVVSKHITRLEKSLGVQLLRRSTRKLSLTEAGQALYERCAHIKTDLEEAEQAALNTHGIPSGTLRVNTTFSFGHLHLVPAVAEFMARFPEIKVELYLGGHYDDLIANGLDLGIRIGQLPDSNLIARRLTIRQMRVCASPDYLKKNGSPEIPEDLYQHQCLLYLNSPTGNEWHFDTKSGKTRIKINSHFASNSSQSLEAAAVAGIGIVLLPGYMMTKHIKQGKLISLLDEYCPANIGIHAVYPATRHLATKVRVFVDFLAERFQSDNYWA